MNRLNKLNKMKNLRYVVSGALLIVIITFMTSQTSATYAAVVPANTNNSVDSVVENTTADNINNTIEPPKVSSDVPADNAEIKLLSTENTESITDTAAQAVEPTEQTVVAPAPSVAPSVVTSVAPAKVQKEQVSDGSAVKPVESTFEYNTDASKGLVPTFNGYTQDDLYCMTVVIYQEAGGDGSSDTSRIYVGNVVLNRLESGLFTYAHSIRGIATAKAQYGRLYWTGVVFPDRAAYEPDAVFRAEQCAIRVLEGERPLPKDVIFQAEFVQGDYTYAHVDGNYFCGKYGA